MKTKLPRMDKATSRNTSSGFMLVEVLVSILLFALGITALVGLQARSLTTTNDAQYRAEAIHLANAYLGQMWASGMGNAGLQTDFSKPGDKWSVFREQVVGSSGYPGIPGGQEPTVVVTPAPNGLDPSVNVTITIAWLDRDGTTMHRYVQTSSVGY
ncbi:MAG: hypothetical protein LBE15_06305 [Burkholderiales bacterium]|nr:hypothetical protein [Burkholderiales bacterium]